VPDWLAVKEDEDVPVCELVDDGLAVADEVVPVCEPVEEDERDEVGAGLPEGVLGGVVGAELLDGNGGGTQAQETSKLPVKVLLFHGATNRVRGRRKKRLLAPSSSQWPRAIRCHSCRRCRCRRSARCCRRPQRGGC